MQLSVQVNGRTYRLSCEDGEEERLQKLAAFVSTHVETLSKEFGNAGDDRLMVMSLLMLADDLFEARERVATLEELLPAKALAKLVAIAAADAKEANDPGAAEDSGLRELEAELPQDEPETGKAMAGND